MMPEFKVGDVVQYGPDQGMIDKVTKTSVIVNLGYTIIDFDPAYAIEALTIIQLHKKGK